MVAATAQIFLQDEQSLRISRSIISIIILNLTDGILTYIGVTNNYVYEMNILMVNIVSDLNKLMLFKLLLPTCALLAVLNIFNRNDYRKMPVGHALVKICLVAYSVIFLMHCYWILATVSGLLLS